jgi:tetratricopeptide (TPR) repeat protein
LFRSIEVGERALADAQADPHADPDVEAELRATLAGTYCETGDLFRAHELTETHERESEDPWSMATQRWSRAMVLQTSGEFAEARALAFEALEILRSMDRPRSTAQLQNTAAWIAMQTPLFDVESIDYMLRDSERVFREAHAPVDLALALSSRAELAIRRGDLRTARACIEESLSLAQGEDSGLRARITASAAQIYAAAGETNESMKRLLVARTLLEESGAKRSAAATWRQMAQTYEDLGEMDLTIACLKAATDLMGLQPPLQTRIHTQHDEAELSVEPSIDLGTSA